MPKTIRNIFLLIGIVGLIATIVIFIYLIMNISSLIEGVDDIFEALAMIVEIPITVAVYFYAMIITFAISMASFVVAIILSFFGDSKKEKVSIEDQAMIDACNTKYTNRKDCEIAVKTHGKAWQEYIKK